MARKVTNLAASVRDRLQNVAKRKQASFQRILTLYAVERLLYRLSVSPHRDRFVLKGAMLYAAWLEDPLRATRDLDLLAFGDREAERFVAIFSDVFSQSVEQDGLSFDTENIVVEPIRDDQMYGGLRVRTSARLGSAVIPIQIDIGFGDAVTPGPLELEYPVLLDQPPPRLNSYPRETVAAEKFEAIVVLDLANSRMKDFYDLLAMSRLFNFEGATLVAAIRATFERRKTSIPREIPPPLTDAFAENPQKAQQWRSFLAREALLIDEPDLLNVVGDIGGFMMPAARGAIDINQAPGDWSPGHGWSSAR